MSGGRSTPAELGRTQAFTCREKFGSGFGESEALGCLDLDNDGFLGSKRALVTVTARLERKSRN